MKNTGVFVNPRDKKLLGNIFEKSDSRFWPAIINGISVFVHELALEKGLPEIPGYYGLNMQTGEFVASLQSMDEGIICSTYKKHGHNGFVVENPN